MSRSKSLKITEALMKLGQKSQAIFRRGHVKPHESARIQEAFHLLNRKGGDIPLGRKARLAYPTFLGKVNEISGPQMVILCALALGKSAIGYMTDQIRLDLPYEIQARFEELTNSVLQTLSEQYSAGYLSISAQPELSTKEDFNTSSATPAPTQAGQAAPENNASYTSCERWIDRPIDLEQDLETTTGMPVTLDLSLSHLMSFFQQHSADTGLLQMVCPLSGVPLPHIHLQSASFSVKVEFSLKTSEALIHHVLANKPSD